MVVINKRIIKRIAIIIASLLIVLVVGAYFVMDYATNKIIRAISLDEGIPLLQEELLPAESLPVPLSPSPTANVAPDLTASPISQAPVSQETIRPSAIPQKYDATISIDKAKEVKKSISLKDQSKISKILLQELSANDISLLTKLASGGMTVEKKKEAKKIILQKLTEDQYNELIQIAAKLGLSQGQNYKDSIKSFQPDS